MRHADGRLLFSATDLSRHLSCAHLTSLRRAAALGEIERPTPYDDPRDEVLKQRGIEHERRLLERFAAEGRAVEIVTPPESPFRSATVPHPKALLPLDRVPPTAQRESVFRLAQEVAASGFAAESPRRAAFDMLRRIPPRFATATPRPDAPGLAPRANIVTQTETPLEALRRIAPRLSRSVLPVQGPPGSGKTYTGARMILDLLAGGKRVGVTANSHKVISNLLGAVCRAVDELPGEGARTGREQGGAAAGPVAVDVRGIQKANDGDGCPDERIVQTDSNEAVAEALSNGDANLAGGTAWLWARPEMADAVDVLVIDEAGRMSLANTLAVCQAAESLVLLGDPRQLDQPIQGVHPPGADVSALGHLLGDSETVDPSRGVFLEHTWRMHPEVCAFTTEQFYEGRLRTCPELARQTVMGRGPLAGHGLRFVPVEHADNTNASFCRFLELAETTPSAPCSARTESVSPPSGTT